MSLVTKARKSPYSVKNVKKITGMEGEGFECTLYKDNKRIGTATDHADGGPILFSLKPGEEGILDDYCSMNFSPIKEKFGDKTITIPYDKESLVFDLVQDAEFLKWAKKQCKTKTLVHIDGTEEGQYKRFDITISDEVRKLIEEKYGHLGYTILNDAI